jgi:hypothetical protein
LITVGVEPQAPGAALLVSVQQRPVRVDGTDTRPHAGDHQDLVADLEVLVLGQDPIGAGMAVVVDPVVAVPAGPAEPDLDKPRPDLLRPGLDGDGAGGARGVWDELVTRHGTGDLVIGGAPAVLPRLDAQPVGGERHRREAEPEQEPPPEPEPAHEVVQHGEGGQHDGHDDHHDGELGAHQPAFTTCDRWSHKRSSAPRLGDR